MMGHHPAQRAGGDAGQRPAASLIHKVDLIVTLIIFSVCTFLLWRTFNFDTVPSSLAQNVQPGTFPQMLLILIMGLALFLPFEYLKKCKRGIDLDSDRRERPKPIVFISAVVILCLAGIMPILGTYPGLLLAAGLLPLVWGERRYKILIPYAFLFPTLLYLLFSSGLQVTFLPGIFGHPFR